MKKFSVLTIASLLLAPITALASCSSTACDTTLTKVYPSPLGGGVVYVQVSEPVTALNCTRVPGEFMSLKSTHPLFKESYALLLSSLQAKSPVRVRIVEGSADCEIVYVWVVAS